MAGELVLQLNRVSSAELIRIQCVTENHLLFLL